MNSLNFFQVYLTCATRFHVHTIRNGLIIGATHCCDAHDCESVCHRLCEAEARRRPKSRCKLRCDTPCPPLRTAATAPRPSQHVSSSPPLQQQPSRHNPSHPRHPHAIHSFNPPSPQSRQKEGAADTQEPLHVLLSAFPVAILQLLGPSQPTHIAEPWAIAPSWTLPLRKLFKTPSPRCSATTRLSRK